MASAQMERAERSERNARALDAAALSAEPVDGADIPLTDLVREAIDEARELAKIEVALAKDEMMREVTQLKEAATLVGIASLVGAMGIVMLLVSLALFIGNAIVSLVIGLLLVGAAAAAGASGWAKLPKKPMGETTRRLQTDVNDLKERIA